MSRACFNFYRLIPVSALTQDLLFLYEKGTKSGGSLWTFKTSHWLMQHLMNCAKPCLNQVPPEKWMYSFWYDLSVQKGCFLKIFYCSFEILWQTEKGKKTSCEIDVSVGFFFVVVCSFRGNGNTFCYALVKLSHKYFRSLHTSVYSVCLGH